MCLQVEAAHRGSVRLKGVAACVHGASLPLPDTWCAAKTSLRAGHALWQPPGSPSASCSPAVQLRPLCLLCSDLPGACAAEQQDLPAWAARKQQGQDGSASPRHALPRACATRHVGPILWGRLVHFGPSRCTHSWWALLNPHCGLGLCTLSLRGASTVRGPCLAHTLG